MLEHTQHFFLSEVSFFISAKADSLYHQRIKPAFRPEVMKLKNSAIDMLYRYIYRHRYIHKTLPKLSIRSLVWGFDLIVHAHQPPRRRLRFRAGFEAYLAPHKSKPLFQDL